MNTSHPILTAQIQQPQPLDSALPNPASFMPTAETSIAGVFAVFLLYKMWGVIQGQFNLINKLVDKLDDDDAVK